MAMDGLHKVESPYQVSRSNAHRNDIDAQYSASLLALPMTANIYRSETRYTTQPDKTYGRELGLGIRLGDERLSAKIRVVMKDGILGKGTDYAEEELSAVASTGRTFGDLSFTGSAGLEGLISDDLHPVAGLRVAFASGQLTPFLKANQSVDAHSPEQRYARYRSSTIEEPLEPLRVLNPNLPVKGHQIEATLIRSAEIGATTSLLRGTVTASVFGWQEAHSAGWVLDGDTALVWSNTIDRSAEGWLAEYRYNQGGWRGSVAATGMNRHGFVAVYDPEPPVRVVWEIGRHKFFYNNAFETDIVVSGKYFASFNSIAEKPGESLGGGFPIDARFTAKISRFTFHYALHNLNGSKYSLIPGYRMMHKEEYWGVEWLLID